MYCNHLYDCIGDYIHGFITAVFPSDIVMYFETYYFFVCYLFYVVCLYTLLSIKVFLVK